MSSIEDDDWHEDGDWGDADWDDADDDEDSSGPAANFSSSNSSSSSMDTSSSSSSSSSSSVPRKTTGGSASELDMPKLERSSSFTIFDPDQITSRMTEVIDEVRDVLGVSAGDAAILLRAYRWKKSRLIDEWVSDSEKVRSKWGLKRDPTVIPTPTASPSAPFFCFICTESVSFQQTHAMDCGHRFCDDCWAHWLKAEMEKGPTVIFTVCPQHKCGDIVPDALFQKYLSQPDFDKYMQYVTSSFVQGSSSIKWCPAPSCGRAAEYPPGGAYDITCSCGNRFCFGCDRSAHRPVPCDLVEKWNLKNASESENANWILANTKVCPRCKVPIEKNQGCNHMTCRNCKFEFCWLCKGEWSEHGSATGGFYKCNRFEDNARKNAVDEEQKTVDRAATELQRYLHYFTRFDNHAKAVKFAERTLSQTENRMKELQDLKGVGFMDVQFLLNAVKTVISCRGVLQWTYAYGYYLPDESKDKSLYETYQEQLEKFCEHLHELSEKPLEELKDIRLRTDVINFTRVTEKYRDNIIKAIEDNLFSS